MSNEWGVPKEEVERVEGSKAGKQRIEELLERYKTLSDDVKAEFKISWKAYLQRSVPHTARRKLMLEDPAIQRATWREMAERFFKAVDRGLAPEKALWKLAA